MAQPYERFIGASLNPLTRLRRKKLIKHLEPVRKKGLNYHPSWCMYAWIKIFFSFFFLAFTSLFMVIRMENSIWQCPLLWEFNDDLTMEMRSQLQSQCSKIWTKSANLGIQVHMHSELKAQITYLPNFVYPEILYLYLLCLSHCVC